MKYQDGYNDGAQGKPPRYPFGTGSLCIDQWTVEVLASHAPSMPDVSATVTVGGASRDPLASAAPAEGQFVEVCRDSEVDPASGAAEVPHLDIMSV